MDQPGVLALMLALAGVSTTYLALHHPALGSALGVAAAVVAVLRELFGE